MDCLPIPQFCLNFLLRSKTYLKGAHLAQALQMGTVVRLVYTHCKVQIMLLYSGLHKYQVLSPQCHALFAQL